jgi:FkbM family methyltransferase
MEENVAKAITNNMLGSRDVVRCLEAYCRRLQRALRGIIAHRSVAAVWQRRLASGARWYDFPPLTAIGLGAAGIMGRLLGVGMTYAQTGEDRIVRALLACAGIDDSHRGFYVDVGANDPVRTSNTFMFYRRGWRGITVEAQPDLVEQHRRVRPRDRAVCAVVSDEVRELTLTEFPNQGFATVEEAPEWAEKQPVRRRQRVRPRTLTDILESEGAPDRFEFLSVDVEGHDLHVLRSLDFSRFRPLLIAAEIYGLRIADGGMEKDPIVALLAGHGYEAVAYAVYNGYFLDRRAGGA